MTEPVVDTSIVLPDAPGLSDRRLRVSSPPPADHEIVPDEEVMQWVTNRKKALGTA